MANPRKIRCSVASLVDHGGHVYTVELKPESPVPSFRPGQFLHLALDPYDPSAFWPESRVFSVASSPLERDRLIICYSVKGAFTRRMERELRVGLELWVKLPYGDFVIQGQEEAVLYAGGTGISAFTAFIGELNGPRKQRIHLYYGVRNPGLLLFRKQLESTLNSCPNFYLTYSFESGGLEVPNDFGGRLRTRSGILSAAAAAQDGFLNGATVFYLSGPPIMLKALSAALNERGVTPDRVRIDAWE